KIVQCPKCASRLSVQDSATAKKVRCPRCAEVFSVGGGALGTTETPLVPTEVTSAPRQQPPVPASSIQDSLPPPPGQGHAEEYSEEPPRRECRSAAVPDVRRRIPTEPEDILSPSEYRNYRNVRAVAVLFVVLGSIICLAG